MNPTPAQSSDVKFEIGHVLFIDIVGYSKLLINEQSEQLETLKKIVRGTEQFKKAEAEGKLLRLPTGDGGALVFRNSPEAPVLCALEITEELQKTPGSREKPQLRLRMGVHSGPVNEISDLNEQANIAGAGINMAQRVMDCGDAGHILLSKHVADDLEHYPHWHPLLHSLGECEVKHAVRIGVVNLHNDQVGNSSVPTKIKLLKRKRTQRRVAAGIALIGALAIVWVGRDRWARRDGRPPAEAGSLPIPDKSIAVLPFENLSDDKSNAYFADGIQDEILTKLASIADLKVISRTSTAKYKSKPEDLKTVSQQLGVAKILEGTVQRAADKVRVNVQLIDARADAHLWAKTYDRDVKDVFAVESEVSQEIADALQAKLSPDEERTLVAAPTKDPEAYDAFLKGEYEEREAESSLKPEPFDRAAVFYQQALDRDPNFGLAAARLAESRLFHHHFVSPMSEAELAEVKSIVDRALSISPNLAEAHIAAGNFHYYGKKQYDDALAEFGRAIELQPNNVHAMEGPAYIHRRQGQWQRAIFELTKCEEVDPRDSALPANIGASYCTLREWEKARRFGLRALALDPHNFLAMHVVVLSYLFGAGDINAAKHVLATFGPDRRMVYFGAIGNSGMEFYLHVVERDFSAALKICDATTGNPDEDRARLAARAAIHVLSGDAESAHDEIEKTRGVLEARLHERPDDEFGMVQLSWVYVALKRNAEALRLAHRATELAPLGKDVLFAVGLLSPLAEIQARAGEPGEAVETLRQLLSMPAGLAISLQQLRIDPVWDPIRNDPGFQQLLAGKELVGPNK